MPILDYSTPTKPAMTNWPWPVLLIVAFAAFVFAPSVACACHKGDYKVYLVLAGTALLFIRTLIAILLREHSLAWTPYLLAVILSFVFGPTLIESLL